MELLTSLREAIDQLAGCDPSALADAGSIVDLERQLARLECVVSRGVQAFEVSGEWALEGAKSPTAWLATRCPLPKAQARAQLRRGRALGHLPVAASAWAEGKIGGAHLDALAKVRTAASAEALARDEALLVHHATELRFEPFLGVLAYWGQLADPEGAEEADLARRARRDVYLAVSISGMHLGQMTLDPISGTIVGGELDRLEAELFEADWAQARAALGREPHLGELARTPGQRRADALVEMATRSRTAPENGRRPEPLFSVVVGYEALHGRICELSDGTVVTPGSLLAYLEGADFERAVFSPGQTGRGLGHRPPVQRGHPPGHRATRPDLHPPLLRRARRRGARSTTSCPTPWAGRPPRRTAGCSAGSTTASATNGHHPPARASSRRARQRPAR